MAQAGHYTALVRSPVTNEWHYFNDDKVTRQKLKEEEFSTSYLLFYHRQGKINIWIFASIFISSKLQFKNQDKSQGQLKNSSSIMLCSTFRKSSVHIIRLKSKNIRLIITFFLFIFFLIIALDLGFKKSN